MIKTFSLDLDCSKCVFMWSWNWVYCSIYCVNLQGSIDRKLDSINQSSCRLFYYIFFQLKPCKVEFIQSFCWLYSVPNLLVIQHLEILYLGGNHVRLVCERMWRKTQECAIKKSLTIRSCDWLTIGKSPEWHTCEACRGSWRVTPTVALQDKTSSLVRQLARDSFSRELELPEHPSRARVARTPCLVVIDSSHSIHTLL